MNTTHRKRNNVKTMSLLVFILVANGLLISSTQACDLTLYKKKVTAKTLYTSKGESISKKMVKKLGCNVSIKLFSTKRLRTMKIIKLEKQLAKLKGGE